MQSSLAVEDVLLGYFTAFDSESFDVHVFHEAIAHRTEENNPSGHVSSDPNVRISNQKATCVYEENCPFDSYSKGVEATKRRRLDARSIPLTPLQIDGTEGSNDSDESISQRHSPHLTSTLLEAMRAECDAAFHHRMQVAFKSRQRHNKQLEPTEITAGLCDKTNCLNMNQCFTTSDRGDHHGVDVSEDAGGGDTESDLVDLACAIDLFEDLELSDESPARYLLPAYWSLRSRASMGLGLSEAQLHEIKRAILDIIPRCIKPSVLGTFFPAESKHTRLYLFNEHYIVKPSFSSVRFRWHIDEEKQLGVLSDAVKYVSVWCPLDDVCGCNGSLVLPRGSRLKHWGIAPSGVFRMSETDALAACTVCSTCSSSSNTSVLRSTTGISDTYDAPASNEDGVPDPCDQGVVVMCRAGSLVLFSSKMPHCSGTNRSALPRRVFYAQYSAGVIGRSATEPLCFAVPV
jgi:hypothetical protein